MHLEIKQANDRTEQVSSTCIDKLYNLSKNGLLDATSDLRGSINATSAYEDAVTFLNTMWGPDLIVTASAYYIKFADPEVERVLTEQGIIPEGGGLTTVEAGTITIGNYFQNNIVIEHFDEFKYFAHIVNEYAFYGCTNLKSIDLTGVTRMPGNGNYFRDCINLEYFHGINSESGVLNLTDLTQLSFGRSFNNCTKLTEVRSLGYIDAIPMGAFEGCSNLLIVNLPQSCTRISTYAFKSCPSLHTINLLYANRIDGDVFNGCSALEYFNGPESTQGELNLPNLTGNLGNNAFKGCTKLTSIASLGSVTSIGSSAFENCAQLATINFPSTITSVGNNAFNNTAWYNNQSAGPIIINDCVLYAYKGDIIGAYVVPNSILYINDGILQSKPNLTSITLSSGVNYIQGGAFQYDNNLSTIVVDSNNVKYDSRDNCNALIETASNTLIAGCKDTIIPNTVTKIAAGALAYLSNLTSIVVPDSVTSIENNAFGRGGMLNAVIGTGITNLGRQVFYADPLQTLTIKATTPPNCADADTLGAIPNSCIIYVPSESVDAYKAANIWKDHASQIRAIPTT